MRGEVVLGYGPVPARSSGSGGGDGRGAQLVDAGAARGPRQVFVAGLTGCPGYGTTLYAAVVAATPRTRARAFDPAPQRVPGRGRAM